MYIPSDDEQILIKAVHDLTYGAGRPWHHRTFKVNLENSDPKQLLAGIKAKESVPLGDLFNIPLSEAVKGVNLLQVDVEGLDENTIEDLTTDLLLLGLNTTVRVASDGRKKVCIRGDDINRFNLLFHGAEQHNRPTPNA